MDDKQKLRLLAALFSLQEEEGDAFDLPTARLVEIASGAAPTSAESAILMASPLAREELALQLQLHDLRTADDLRGANDDDFSLASSLAAAKTALGEELDLHCRAGVLIVKRGPNSRMPFLLTLTLDAGYGPAAMLTER